MGVIGFILFFFFVVVVVLFLLRDYLRSSVALMLQGEYILPNAGVSGQLFFYTEQVYATVPMSPS